MSNWGYPQWIMASWILLGLVATIIRKVEKSRKNDAELLLDAKQEANDWQIGIFTTAVTTIIEVWLLAKGGFW